MRKSSSMGKQSGKKKKTLAGKAGESFKLNNKRNNENSPRAYDSDTAVFISMSQELKDEGNKLFQRRDYEGAMLKYEKALKLLPGNHIDVSYLRSNMAACYMQMGLSDYPRAIHECNLALEVTPKYSKALLKRARCYEALNRLDLALRDVNIVLKMEPNNLMALEIEERVKSTIEQRGTTRDIPVDMVPVPEYFEPPVHTTSSKSKEKARKQKTDNIEEKKVDDIVEDRKHETGDDETRERTSGEKEKNVNDNKKHETETNDKKAENRSEEKELEDKFKKNKVEERIEEKKTMEKGSEDKIGENKFEERIEEKKAEDKLVVDEKIANTTEEGPRRTVKLVLGEDIRWAQIPIDCSLLKLREIIRDRFPNPEAVLIKYKDHEGDLVTITTTEELRLAEASTGHGSFRLYIVEVNPDQDPFLEKVKKENGHHLDAKQRRIVENGNVGRNMDIQKKPCCIDDWIVQFVRLFKNYVGLDSDEYLDLHEVGMELYSEAIEETITSEEAQDLFGTAANKFQDMAALALFNWGNVHMSRARKRVFSTDEASRESALVEVQSGYNWAQNEYSKAGMRYEEALKIKPDFYEAVLALGQQQFEQAKLSWYYAIGTNVDLESWPSTEVFELYNKAEENMEKGMLMWEEAEEKRLAELSLPSKAKTLLQNMKLDSLVKDLSADEVAEQAANIRSQMNILWGSMLYERSIMEFKLGVPVWQECLEVAVEKFELAGASPTDITIMIKNHCSNNSALEGLGFNIDEIIQAWNEMSEAKRWRSGIPSFRLEPLLRRRVSKLYDALGHS